MQFLLIIVILLNISMGMPFSRDSDEYDGTVIWSTMEVYYIIADTLTIMFLLLAVYYGGNLYLFMKGGELTLSWRWLVGGTILFALGKIIEIAYLAGIISDSEWLVRTLYAIVAVFLTLGFYQQKKTLTI